MNEDIGQARPYCPGCPEGADVDPHSACVVAQWCSAHAPTLDGLDDARASASCGRCISDEVAGEDNRIACDVIHRGHR